MRVGEPPLPTGLLIPSAFCFTVRRVGDDAIRFQLREDGEAVRAIERYRAVVALPIGFNHFTATTFKLISRPDWSRWGKYALE